MEVFVPWDGGENSIEFLEQCLNGWGKVRFAEPMVIGIKPDEKADVKFRVAADGLAKGDYYILSDIDARPEETYVISAIHKRLALSPRVGLALVRPVFDVGGRVRIVRKGAVEKWPHKVSGQYDQEHAEAVVGAGYTFETWDDVHYRHLPSLAIN